MENKTFRVYKSSQATKDWIVYRCKSGQPLFIYSQKTGEHKWVNVDFPSGAIHEGRPMDGEPVVYKELCTIATQTDDNNCSNGCLSMYISTDSSFSNNCEGISRVGSSQDNTAHKDSANQCEKVLHRIKQEKVPQDDEEITGTPAFHYGRDVSENEASTDDVDHNYRPGMDEISEMLRVLEEFDVPYASESVQNGEAEQSMGNEGAILNESGKEVNVSTHNEENTSANDVECPENMECSSHCSEENNEEVNLSNPESHTNVGRSRKNRKERPQSQDGETRIPQEPIPVEGFKCLQCSKSFNLKARLLCHEILIHSGVKPFECSFCLKRFDKKVNLKAHEKVHVGEKPFECTQCNMKFENQNALKQHLQTHSKAKPFQCSFCSKTFSQKTYLNQHLKVHTNERFVCIYCKKSFVHKWAHLKHLKTHRNPLACSHCGAKFPSRNRLETHLAKHAKIGKNKFKCPICPRKFRYSNTLEQHMEMHTDITEKAFECSFCKKKFASENSLQIHLQTHTGEKGYQCPHCPKKFNNNGPFQQHVRIHSSEKPFQCQECDKRFRTKAYLDKHIPIHSDYKPFACPHCPMRFRRQCHLRQHLTTHSGEKPYECAYCGKKFRDNQTLLYKHMPKHEGEKLVCQPCNKEFLSRGSLTAHNRKVHGKQY